MTIPQRFTVIRTIAFWGCSGLLSLTLPSALVTIGEGAFCYCSGLAKLTLPNSLATIGEHAFYGCSGLTKLVLPDTVTTIEAYAFCACTGLTEIVLPGALRIIEKCAFKGCENLRVVTMFSVQNFGEGVFKDCTALQQVSAPPSVAARFPDDMFDGCPVPVADMLAAASPKLQLYYYFSHKSRGSLSSPAAKQAVNTVLLIHKRSKRDDCDLPYMPPEMWDHILGFLRKSELGGDGGFGDDGGNGGDQPSPQVQNYTERVV